MKCRFCPEWADQLLPVTRGLCSYCSWRLYKTDDGLEIRKREAYGIRVENAAKRFHAYCESLKIRVVKAEKPKRQTKIRL